MDREVKLSEEYRDLSTRELLEKLREGSI